MSGFFAGAVTAQAINGVGLATPEGAVAVRFLPLFPEQGLFDGKLTFTTLRELGPHHPDDLYHRIVFDVPVERAAINRFLGFEHHEENGTYVFRFEEGEAATVTLEWALREEVVYGRLSVTRPLPVIALGFGCLKPAVVSGGVAEAVNLQEGDMRAQVRYDRPATATAQANTLGALEGALRGYMPDPRAGEYAGHLYALTPDAPLCFTLGIGTAPVPVRAEIAALLEAGRGAIPTRLMRGSGEAGEILDAYQQIIGFMKSYYPARDLRAVPVNRAWGGMRSLAPVFCWDNFFDSYFTAFFDPALAKESLRHILDVLDEDLTKAPPQRNLIVPTLYSRTVRLIGDRDYARQTFPAIMKFLRFWFDKNPDGHPWRDGNDDGLIECGSFAHLGEMTPARLLQHAFDETGYDDSPMYSDGFAYHREGVPAHGVKFLYDRGTLNLTMVGQNALYVAACRSVAVVADWLGEEQDAQWLRAEATRVAGLIETRLFCAERGYYMNRFFDGHFSTVKTMTIFYPLLAGLGDQAAREKLHATLRDPAQFWGEYVIPTVSRDDPSYCRQPHWDAKGWPGNYWRGFIWGPTNYITWLAIANAGWDETAAEFAAKSRRQFLQDWRDYRICSENYPPEGRTDPTRAWFKNGGRCAHYAWSLCMAMPALESLFAVEAQEEGIRCGTTQSELFGSWEKAIYQGEEVTVRCDAQGLEFRLGTRLELTADRPLEIRALRLLADGGCALRYTSAAPVTLRITCAGRISTHTLPAATNAEIRN